jgi:hypothetical protein
MLSSLGHFFSVLATRLFVGRFGCFFFICGCLSFIEIVLGMVVWGLGFEIVFFLLSFLAG